MKKIAIFVFLQFLFLYSYAQSSGDSIAGTYLFTQEIGGGFTGGPNGKCMVLPSDGSIVNKLIIDTDLNVYKISDTTIYNGISWDWNCDTLCIGTCKIVKDSLIVSFIKKPNCRFHFLKSKLNKPEAMKNSLPLLLKNIIFNM